MKKRIALLLATLLTLPLVLTLLPASPASASHLPLCTRVVNHRNGAGQDMAVPAASSGSTDCLLGRNLAPCGGLNCESIVQLQRSIRTCYGIAIAVDGWFGSQTESALREVQRRVGAAQDGIYGPETKRKMRHESNDVPGTCHPF